MAEDVVIIGAGGHGRVIADIVRLRGDRLLGFLDDGTANPFNLPIIGRVADAAKYMGKAAFLIGIGTNAVRERISRQLAGARFYTAVHPSAVIAQDVVLGAGTAVMALCAVNVGAVVGRHCILNTCCSVDHDCAVGDFTHISPGARLTGGVKVGARCLIGTGAVILPGKRVCDGTTIGGGAVVTRDVTREGTYVGVPARPLEGGA